MRALLLIYFIATIAHTAWADELNPKKSKTALFISKLWAILISMTTLVSDKVGLFTG